MELHLSVQTCLSELSSSLSSKPERSQAKDNDARPPDHLQMGSRGALPRWTPGPVEALEIPEVGSS